MQSASSRRQFRRYRKSFLCRLNCLLLCTAAKARGKTGKGAEEGGGATGVAISLGHSFREMSSSHPKHGHWHAAARTTKYAQSNQNISKQIFDMFPRFFLELRRSKKELELREPQLQPELQPRHQARGPPDRTSCYNLTQGDPGCVMADRQRYELVCQEGRQRIPQDSETLGERQ